MLPFLQKNVDPSDSTRRIFYATLSFFSVGVLLLCGFYFTIGINVWTSWATCAFLVFLSLQAKRNNPHEIASSKTPRDDGQTKNIIESFVPQTFPGIVLFGTTLFCFLTILLTAISARTGEALISPWNILPPALFALYGIGLLCTMLVGHLEKNRCAIPLGMLFTFVSTSIAALVYGNGFGFDPFLHRAAEAALVQDGFIKPLQLLYSGQYALVAAIHSITFLPIKWIDIWLLPFLASWFLPLGATIGLRDGWGLSDREARTWWPVIFLIPFSLITFTVPFTVTYLFFLLFCFLWPVLLHRVDPNGQIAGLSLHRSALCLSFLAATFFHPLLAVPMLVFCLGIWLRNFHFIPLPRGNRGGLALLTVILIALSVPVMLFVSHAAPDAPHLSSLFQHRELFFNLFRSPYWDPYPFIPWTLQALYGFRYWLPMVLFVFALLYCASTLVQKNTSNPRLQTISIYIWIFAVGLLLAIWGTSTLFSFKNIIVHEQSEFALRLLQAAFTFPLPIFAVLLARIVRQYPRMLFAMIGLVVSCITISWFFSYPQFNLKYPFFSPSVSDDDIAVVHKIDTRSNGEPYLVLVHQMTSAAAIQEFGFSQTIKLDGEEILRYPIPTGGTLYPFYEDLLYNGITREKVDALQKRTGVAHIYFITHDYWSWSEDVLQSLSESADTHIRESSLTLWTFDYVTR